MIKVLEAYIGEESKKHITKHHKYHNSLHIEFIRIKKRLKIHSEKEIKKPDYWSRDKNFNPFSVYSNRKAIAKSIAKKINNKTYEPKEPEFFMKKKKDGGERKITIYQLPDAAVSNYYYKRLLSKNKHRLSSFCYAYRDDRNVHFAVQDISLELKKNSRIFVAEFDFRKFFDSISHDFLYQQLKENGFLITQEELRIIKAFLGKKGKAENKKKGIPQGLSLSLFLANVTCWSLDRELENNGLRFARYADDTLIWSKDYNKIVEAFNIIDKFSKAAGVEINYNKSEGISLLTPKEFPREFSKAKSYVEFLGYNISSENISIKDESVLKIKERITSILYQNLIFPLKKEVLNSKRIPSYIEDRDYLVAINQIRKYLYGDLTDEKINSYLKGKFKKINFKGMMSFYLLIDNEEQLKELDQWLGRTLINTLKLRKKLFEERGVLLEEFPYDLNYKNLIAKSSKKLVKGLPLYKVPSFFRIKKAITKGISEEGIVKVMNPKANEYNYNEI